MDIQDELRLSYYREISTINNEHKITLVQNISTGRICVKKILDIYNYDVYSYIKDNPIKGIPCICELIKDDTTLIVIEDFISGSGLDEIIKAEGALKSDRVIQYTLKLCEILKRLHGSPTPIIHRDIKPSNIIITPTDDVVLLDLNAAKYASGKDSDTMLLGTKGYAAPEQYGFGSSGPQTDIYATGVLMNTMLNGGYSPRTYHGRLSGIIDKCTQLTPGNRYSSVDELSDALQSMNNGSFTGPVSLLKRYALPGFRSGKIINMMVAAAYYIWSISVCANLNFKMADGITLYIERFGCLCIMLSWALCSLNYLDIYKTVPICKSDNVLLKMLGILILNIIVSAVILFLTIVICMLISY